MSKASYFRCCFLILLLYAASTPVLAQEILFSDDFSDESSGWATFKDSGGEVFYEDAELHIKDYPFYQLATWTSPSQFFTDFILDVDTKLVDGTDSNWHIICLRLKDDYNYYGFHISSDGWYYINKVIDQKDTIFVQPTRSAYIDQGKDANNHIHIECIGSNLNFSVNGHKLRDVNDTTFSEGDIGLAAAALKGPSTEVTFDNLTIIEPRASQLLSGYH